MRDAADLCLNISMLFLRLGSDHTADCLFSHPSLLTGSSVGRSVRSVEQAASAPHVHASFSVVTSNSVGERSRDTQAPSPG